MTMPLSISFSRATASAIAISSALLALTAAGAVAILLFLYSLDLFGAFSAERRGGLNELVGQDELGRCDCGKGQSVRLAALVDELHGLVFDPLERARILPPVALKGFSEGDPRLVAGPIGKILEAGQRPVDAGRAHFEPVAAIDRIAQIEHIRQAARDSLAIGEVELARVGALSHHLQRRVRAAADHRQAHELVAEVLNLGLDDPLQAGYVRQSNSLCMYVSNVSRTGPARDQPQHQ